jgi:hypothetical protein
MKKKREAARSIEVAKKKAEKQRQKDLDRLKQQKMEESAKMEAEEEKKQKRVELELVRVLRFDLGRRIFFSSSNYLCFFSTVG